MEKTLRGAAEHATDSLLSTQVGEFIVQERIGSGGMGVVYRAVHPLIGKQVAIKVLRAELVSQQQVERLLIEARAVNAIRHPGIIDIFGFGSLPDGRPYIIMELLRGYSLSAFIRQRERLDVNTTVRVLDEMLAALGAAHRAGVVHRDLKPGNVFMAETADGTHAVKLVDFGIAKLVQSQEGPTTLEGTILGTPEFMAPEQIRGAPSSPSADLYAVGVIAFQMLTGQRPFKGEPFQVLFAHIEQPPPLPSSLAPGIPPELDTLVLQLLAKDPALRPSSAETVRQALKRVPRTAVPSPVPRPETSVPVANVPEGETWATQATPPLDLPDTRRGRQWIVGLALLAGVGGGVALFWPTESADPLVSTAEAQPIAKVEEAPQGPSPSEQGPVLAAVLQSAPQEMEAPASEVALPMEQARPAEPTVQPVTTGAEPTKPASYVAGPSGVPPSEPRQPAAAMKGSLPGPKKDSAQSAKTPLSSFQAARSKELQRLAEIEKEHPPLAKGHADSEIMRELRRLRTVAPTVNTTGDLDLLRRGIDALTEKLNPPAGAKPTQANPKAGEKPSTESAATAALPWDAKQQEKVQNIQRELLTSYEQKLRQKAGSSPIDPAAMEELRQLNSLVATLSTSAAFESFKKRRANWEYTYLNGKKTSAGHAP